MKKINHLYSAFLTVCMLMFLGSCGVSKYRGQGFGGFDFKSKIANTKNIELKSNENIQVQNIHLSKEVNQYGSLESSKIEIIPTKPNKNYKVDKIPVQISESKLVNLTSKVNAMRTNSILKLEKKLSDIKEKKSKSDVWKLLFRIMGNFFLLSGIFLMILGAIAGNSYFHFGTFFALMGLAAAIIGIIFIILGKNLQ